MNSLNIASNMLAQSVRALRENRGLSLGGLAELAAISKASLSKIEAGEANPSLEILCRLSQALNVTIGALLGEDNLPELRVVRAGDSEIIQSDSGLSIRPINTEGSNRRSEVYELIMPPNSLYSSEPHLPGTSELIICLEGTIKLGPQGREVELEPGDSVWFRADLPHSYTSANGARGLLVMSYLPSA
jgi:XRE family transcriptional regulator, regulator of sulfur utilization